MVGKEVKLLPSKRPLRSEFEHLRMCPASPLLSWRGLLWPFAPRLTEDPSMRWMVSELPRSWEGAPLLSGQSLLSSCIHKGEDYVGLASFFSGEKCRPQSRGRLEPDADYFHSKTATDPPASKCVKRNFSLCSWETGDVAWTQERKKKRRRGLCWKSEELHWPQGNVAEKPSERTM